MRNNQLTDLDNAALDLATRIIKGEYAGMIIVAVKVDGDIDMMHTIQGLTNAEVVIVLNDIIKRDEE